LRGDMTAGGTGSASWTTYFTPEASPITLSIPGSAMRVTWQFTLTDVAANNTSQNFRFAVVDTPGAQRLVANGAPANAAFTGYSIFGNMSSGVLGNSNPFQLRERQVASGDLMSTSGNWGANGVANQGLANGATAGNAGYTAGVLYTLVWTITRNSSAGLDHLISLSGGTLDGDGSASISVTDPSPNMGSFSFDTFAIRPSGATTTARLFDTSLFRVEAITAIPEAASAITWAIIGLTCCVRRRRDGAKVNL